MKAMKVVQSGEQYKCEKSATVVYRKNKKKKVQTPTTFSSHLCEVGVIVGSSCSESFSKKSRTTSEELTAGLTTYTVDQMYCLC